MKNKGFLLISSIFLVFFLGLILSVSLMRSDIQLRALDLRRVSLDAFYVAEAGIERAVFELRRDQGWRAGFDNEALFWEGEEGEQETVGFYTVQVADGDPVGSLPTVWLLSYGDAQYQNKTVSRYIRARVVVENPAAFFTSTIGDLTIGSGADIAGSILGRDIIFEVNDGLPPEQRWITVDGDVEYIRNIEGEGDPYVNITGDVRQRPPITFVSVDLTRYRELAQGNGRYIDGDFTYSGEIDWENLETSNGLVFAEGDIHISGEVTQSIHFVSGGDIYIDDEITCTVVDDIQTQIGLSAHGDVIISEEAPSYIDIDAFVIADGGLFEADGDKASKDELNFEGAIVVRGREGERTVVDLNVYITRNYTYDAALRDNLQIPFMSFIANIINWEEVGPDDVIPPA